MRHNPDRGIMTKLVKTRSVKIYLMEKSGLRRDLNKILSRLVERPRAADAKICAGRGTETFGVRD